MAQKKNRTGSEGGEKARYPSPVVGTKIKKNGAYCLLVWGLSANSRLNNITKVFYHNKPDSTREISVKNTVFFAFFTVLPANLSSTIARFKAS